MNTGLWERKSKQGNTYYAGKITIGDKTYLVNLFKNNKQNDKQPDYNIMLKDAPEKVEQETPQEEPQVDIFAEFGKEIDNSDFLD